MQHTRNGLQAVAEILKDENNAPVRYRKLHKLTRKKEAKASFGCLL